MSLRGSQSGGVATTTLLRGFALNHLVCRIPWIALRMRCYAKAGVQLDEGASTSILMDSEVIAPERLSIGAHTTVGRHCVLDCRGGVRIGRNVNISSHVMLLTAKHLINSPSFEDAYQPITIGDNAWVATRATIIDGVTIGEGAVVAAGAVVTKDVEPYTVVGGTPAIPIGTRERDVQYAISFRPDWM
jgi:putative colanic acid biosynthesis acetyltransferase WcaF